MFELDARLANDTLTLGDFGLSRVLLMKDKRYPWCILVPQVANITEAFQLDAEQQQQLNLESMMLGKTLMDLHQGDSLNIAALGNVVSQLHVHHVVRFNTDETWPGPVWGQGTALAYTEQELSNMALSITERLQFNLGFIAV